uniref:WEB family protein, chloroplastic n=1 Tax=Noccaea caerulescens TaxID=107243 RepID=A0A1J3I9Y5_NOCCA
MASKIKSGLTETALRKSSPTYLRVPKLTRIVTKSEPNSPSPTQTQPSRLSLDRSSVNSKPSSAEKRSPKVPTPPERTQTKAVRGSEPQPRLIQIKEDLRKANEQIALLENDKAKAHKELKEARKEAEEASKKLDEALKAQEKANENFEIEKFEAVEAGIEAVQRKEEELKKEIDDVKKRDSAALLLVTRELERVNQELASANAAKSKVLIQADDATKLAAIHAEKVDILSSELIRLKALLDSTREKETISNKEIASKLGAEIVVLKRELDNARSFKEEVKEREMVIERLKVDLEAAKMAESYAQDSADEWHKKAKELEEELEEANTLKRSASVSLVSVTKQLERSNDRLHAMESEITDLKEKIRLMETTISRQKEDVEESEQRVGIAEEELSKVEREAEKLKNELEAVKEEKNQISKKEKDASSSVERLLEENNKILSELESSKEEEEKSKKAMESLASALHQVSSEAREMKEKLSSHQGDEDYETQVEDLRSVIKATNEKYESMLDEAKHEIDVLVSAVEQNKKQLETSMVDWEMREAGLVNHVKKFDEEVSSMGKEMNRLGNLVKRAKEEADAAWKKEAEMRDSLKEVEDEVISLQETLREARSESLKINEKMLDKESEFQSIVHENDELRMKQDGYVKKIKELSKLLEEALVKKHREEKGELSESEKDYDLLPKVVEFSEENGHRSGEEKLETLGGMKMRLEEETEKEKKEDSPDGDDDTVEVEFKMWESFEVGKKEGSHKGKAEHESPKEDEEDSNMVDESVKDTGNGLAREDELVKEKKKKKTLFGKVGNLLKKKGPVNQK